MATALSQTRAEVDPAATPTTGAMAGGIATGNTKVMLTFEEEDLELRLATEVAIATTAEGSYLYFGLVQAPAPWIPSEQPTAKMQLVAKLFLPNPTMDTLYELVAAYHREHHEDPQDSQR